MATDLAQKGIDSGEDMTFVVNGEVDNDTDLDQVQQAAVGDMDVFELFVFIGGQPFHQFSDYLWYDLPRSLTDGLDREDTVLFWLYDVGILQEMILEWVGDILRMYTNHFSYFVIGDTGMLAFEPDTPCPPYYPG